MKEILSALFLLLVSILHSQNIIRGKVINQENEIIENASITIEDPSDNGVLAFSITDGINFCPPKPGFTDINRTISKSSSKYSIDSGVEWGFKTIAGFIP